MKSLGGAASLNPEDWPAPTQRRIGRRVSLTMRQVVNLTRSLSFLTRKMMRIQFEKTPTARLGFRLVGDASRHPDSRMSTPSDSIATDASVVDDDTSIARRATDDFLSDAVSALRVFARAARRSVSRRRRRSIRGRRSMGASSSRARRGRFTHPSRASEPRARRVPRRAYAPPSSAFAAIPPRDARRRHDVAARRRLDRARSTFVRERFGDVLRGTPYVLDITTGEEETSPSGNDFGAVAEAVDADAVCMSTPTEDRWRDSSSGASRITV